MKLLRHNISEFEVITEKCISVDPRMQSPSPQGYNKRDQNGIFKVI